MEPNPEHALRAAQGYTELGMPEDALLEIASLPPEWQEKPEAITLRLFGLMATKRWREALDTAFQLCAVAPDNHTGYIHAAFCLHELGRTSEARELLIKGPSSLQSEPVYHYNLACYEARLGNDAAAWAHLERSFRMDRKFKEFAKYDPDLATLRGLL